MYIRIHGVRKQLLSILNTMLSSALNKIRPVATSQTVVTDLGIVAALTGDSAGLMYTVNSMFGIITQINPNGTKTVIAGAYMNGYSDGVGSAAKFNTPRSAACDASGNVYVADDGNNVMRKIVVSTVGGSPVGTVTTVSNASVSGIREVAVNEDGSTIAMRTAGSAGTLSNLLYYTNGNNYGKIGLSGFTGASQDFEAVSVVYGKDGYFYYSPYNIYTGSVGLYRINTPSLSSSFVSVAGGGSSPIYATGTELSNAGLIEANPYKFYGGFISGPGAGTAVVGSNFINQYAGMNGKSSDVLGSSGGRVYIDTLTGLWPTGVTGPITISRKFPPSPLTGVLSLTGTENTTISLSGANLFVSGSLADGFQMNFYMGNNVGDLTTIAGTGPYVISGIPPGLFDYYNGDQSSLIPVFYDFGEEGTGTGFQLLLFPPTGNISVGGFASYGNTATVTPITGITPNISNLMCLKPGVIIGINIGVLYEYNIVGTVATRISSNDFSMYNTIGAVPNPVSTVIPEVYTLIADAGTNDNGRLIVLRNVY